MMFRENYKNAYQNIKPLKNNVELLLAEAAKKQADGGPSSSREQAKAAGSRKHGWKPALAALTVCIGLGAAFPVCAAHIPAVYRLAEWISPEMADVFVPVEKSSVSQEIELQVEAVSVKENKAEVIVSFRDTGTLDRIRGKVDMYDSYGLVNLSASGISGGCSFLHYEEESGKAFFKVMLQADQEFDREKLTFYVNELLCGLTEERRSIELGEVAAQAGTRDAVFRGYGSSPDAPDLPESMKGVRSENDPRKIYQVLDMTDPSDCSPDDITYTGAAYMDGFLRVQLCMGDNTHADRHVLPTLTDGKGMQMEPDYSVSWFEDAAGTRYTFDEYWFAGPFENLDGLRLQGDFYDTGESVEGDWRVTFRLDRENGAVYD